MLRMPARKVCGFTCNSSPFLFARSFCCWCLLCDPLLFFVLIMDVSTAAPHHVVCDAVLEAAQYLQSRLAFVEQAQGQPVAVQRLI